MKIKKKHLRQWFTAVGVVIGSAVIAVLSTQYLTFLNSLENIASDIRIAALQPPMPQSEDIVIAAITEETVTQFPYRSPVDREFLADLLLALQAKGAKVIGVDVLLDQPTEPEKDDLLRQTIRDMQVPTFFSYTNTPSIVNEEQLEYLNEFVPEPMRAAANLATDPFDGTVRWIFPGETNPGMPIGFPRKAVEMVGMDTNAERVEIAWRPRPDLETPSFPVYPSHAVPVLPEEWFKGKIVLIGAVLSITDRHRTPLSVVYDGDLGMMPGIIVQAHGVSQLLDGRKPHRLSQAWAYGTSLLMSILGVLMVLTVMKRGIAASVVLGTIVVAGFWLGGMLGFTHGLPLIPLVAPTLALALAMWMMDVFVGGAERKQREFVQSAFSRYVSPAVVGQLVENPEALSIRGERKELTFLFTDVASFTTMSENLTSEKLSEVLNAYLDGACEIILRYEGTIDKFIGDAIMAIFNAPIDQPDHYERAVRCALELDAYAEKFRLAKNEEGISMGVTRMGVHAGQAVIGNFGSRSRLDFTALGDTVNTAARCEGVNKYFGTRLCCTESVVEHCKNVKFKPVGDIVLKGKHQPVTLFCPVTEQETQEPLFKRYLETYALLKSESPDAPSAVEKLAAEFPEDPLVKFHLKRVQSGLNTALVVMEDK